MVGLKIEDDQLFHALKEHFPAHNAWDLMEQWKAKVAQIHGQLPALCQWVVERLGVPVLPKFNPENPGINSRFAQTVVSNALEDLIHGRPVNDFYRRSVENQYETSNTSSGRLWSLTWSLMRDQYVIAISETEDEIMSLKRRHIEFREEIRDIPEMQGVVTSYRQWNQCGDDLCKELEHIMNRAIFHGRCVLCTG